MNQTYNCDFATKVNFSRIFSSALSDDTVGINKLYSTGISYTYASYHLLVKFVNLRKNHKFLSIIHVASKLCQF